MSSSALRKFAASNATAANARDAPKNVTVERLKQMRGEINTLVSLLAPPARFGTVMWETDDKQATAKAAASLSSASSANAAAATTTGIPTSVDVATTRFVLSFLPAWLPRFEAKRLKGAAKIAVNIALDLQVVILEDVPTSIFLFVAQCLAQAFPFQQSREAGRSGAAREQNGIALRVEKSVERCKDLLGALNYHAFPLLVYPPPPNGRAKYDTTNWWTETAGSSGGGGGQQQQQQQQQKGGFQVPNAVVSLRFLQVMPEMAQGAAASVSVSTGIPSLDSAAATPAGSSAGGSSSNASSIVVCYEGFGKAWWDVAMLLRQDSLQYGDSSSSGHPQQQQQQQNNSGGLPDFLDNGRSPVGSSPGGASTTSSALAMMMPKQKITIAPRSEHHFPRPRNAEPIVHVPGHNSSFVPHNVFLCSSDLFAFLRNLNIDYDAVQLPATTNSGGGVKQQEATILQYSLVRFRAAWQIPRVLAMATYCYSHEIWRTALPEPEPPATWAGAATRRLVVGSGGGGFSRNSPRGGGGGGGANAPPPPLPTPAPTAPIPQVQTNHYLHCACTVADPLVIAVDTAQSIVKDDAFSVEVDHAAKEIHLCVYVVSPIGAADVSAESSKFLEGPSVQRALRVINNATVAVSTFQKQQQQQQQAEQEKTAAAAANNNNNTNNDDDAAVLKRPPRTLASILSTMSMTMLDEEEEKRLCLSRRYPRRTLCVTGVFDLETKKIKRVVGPVVKDVVLQDELEHGMVRAMEEEFTNNNNSTSNNKPNHSLSFRDPTNQVVVSRLNLVSQLFEANADDLGLQLAHHQLSPQQQQQQFATDSTFSRYSLAGKRLAGKQYHYRAKIGGDGSTSSSKWLRHVGELARFVFGIGVRATVLKNWGVDLEEAAPAGAEQSALGKLERLRAVLARQAAAFAKDGKTLKDIKTDAMESPAAVRPLWEQFLKEAEGDGSDEKQQQQQQQQQLSLRSSPAVFRILVHSLKHVRGANVALSDVVAAATGTVARSPVDDSAQLAGSFRLVTEPATSNIAELIKNSSSNSDNNNATVVDLKAFVAARRQSRAQAAGGFDISPDTESVTTAVCRNYASPSRACAASWHLSGICALRNSLSCLAHYLALRMPAGNNNNNDNNNSSSSGPSSSPSSSDADALGAEQRRKLRDRIAELRLGIALVHEQQQKFKEVSISGTLCCLFDKNVPAPLKKVLVRGLVSKSPDSWKSAFGGNNDVVYVYLPKWACFVAANPAVSVGATTPAAENKNSGGGSGSNTDSSASAAVLKMLTAVQVVVEVVDRATHFGGVEPADVSAYIPLLDFGDAYPQVLREDATTPADATRAAATWKLSPVGITVGGKARVFYKLGDEAATLFGFRVETGGRRAAWKSAFPTLLGGDAASAESRGRVVAELGQL